MEVRIAGRPHLLVVDGLGWVNVRIREFEQVRLLPRGCTDAAVLPGPRLVGEHEGPIHVVYSFIPSRNHHPYGCTGSHSFRDMGTTNLGVS